jgi:hypothetical protein
VRGFAGRPIAHRLVGLLLFVCFIAIAAAVDAAEAGGIVRVHVRSAARRDVSATVVVTMASTSVPGRQWKARVEPGGVATFRNVPSAVYQLAAGADGAQPKTIEIAVEAGEIADVDAESSSLGATLEISSISRVSAGVTFSGRMLGGAPAQRISGLLDTAEPFVIVDRMDGGGLLTGQAGLVGSRGSSWTNLTMSFGDIEVIGPTQGGRSGLVPDVASIAAASVTTGAAPVDVATPGVDLTLVPKWPGSTPSGSVSAATTSGRMAGRNGEATAPSIYRLDSFSQVTGELGLPLSSRAGFYLAADSSRSRQETRAENLELPGNLTSAFGLAVAHPTKSDEVRASALLERATTAFDGRDALANRDVTEGDSFMVGQAAWEHVGDAGRRALSLGVSRGTLTPDVASGVAGGTVDRIFDGILPGPPSAVTSTRLTGSFEFDPKDVVTGGVSHALRLGGTVRRSTESTSVQALPTVAEVVAGVPARVWMNQAPASGVSDRHATELVAFASDLMQLAPRLTLDVGLRANVTSAAATGATQGVSWQTVAPRAGLRWAPSAMTFFAGYSRYYAPLPLDWLAFGDPGAPTSQVFRWTDANHDGKFEPGEQGALVSLAGAGAAIASIDPGLRPAVTDEVTFGAEHWFGTSFRLHVAATIRHERDLAAVVDTGAPTSSYAQTFIPDQGEDFDNASDDRLLAVYNRLPATFGLDKYLLTNPVGDTSRYEGLEVSGEARGTHVSAIVGATAYLTRAGSSSPGFTALENDQALLGQRYLDPNSQPFEPGSVFSDRSYVLKWTTVYDGPHDVHAAFTARYQDGQPFTRLVVVPDLNQGAEALQAYRIGRTRFYFTLTLDAQLSKGFRFGRSREARFTVNVYNLTNQASEVEENPISGPSFRATTAVQPPRTIRVGLNIKF